MQMQNTIVMQAQHCDAPSYLTEFLPSSPTHPCCSRCSPPLHFHLALTSVEKTDGTDDVDVAQEGREAASQQDSLLEAGSSISAATSASGPRQMGPALVPVFKAAITLVKECVWKTEVGLLVQP